MFLSKLILDFAALLPCFATFISVVLTVCLLLTLASFALVNLHKIAPYYMCFVCVIDVVFEFVFLIFWTLLTNGLKVHTDHQGV